MRLERDAASLVAEAAGDHGLGPIIDARPDVVRWLDVDGDNPDIDTASDLARAAELAWAERVRQNREQVDRFREAPDGQDFYASVSSIFRDDPNRAGRSGPRRPARARAPRRHVGRHRCRRGPLRAPARPGRPRGHRPRSVALDARRPARDGEGARDRERRAHPGALARCARGGRGHRGPPARRRLADRPRRLRRRGHRPVRGRDGASGQADVPGGAHGAEPGIPRGAVLAPDPWRGAGRAPGAPGLRRPPRHPAALRPR